jgi:hypothetical protein
MRDTTTNTEQDAAKADRATAWDDREPRACKWCDSEGVVWLVGGGTEPCPECNGLGVIEHGF